MIKKNLVLYHNHCTDGFLSATLMYLYFKEIGELEKTEFIAVNYNEPIPMLSGMEVYIVDFSYSKEVIIDSSGIANSITMLDHHLTAAQQWDGYGTYVINSPNCCKVTIKINEHKSGAGLTYDWIDERDLKSDYAETSVFKNLNDNRILKVTRAVQDRDLWKFKLENTKEIYEALNILPRTFEAWEEFLVTSSYEVFEEKIKAAGYYLEVKEKLAQEYASKHQMQDFLGYRVPIVNCPANFASRVCEILAKDYPFAVSYCLSLSEIFVSLRSNSITGIDVSEVAKNFKGGGHKNASGCKIPTQWIYYFISGQLEFIKRQISPELYTEPVRVSLLPEVIVNL